MPYRRLPNTDLSRIKALQKASSMEGYRENGELILSYKATQEALMFLNKFQRLQRKYESCNSLHLQSSKTYRNELHMARMYVSHFIQVLNMTIMRGELRKEIKSEYGLNPDSNEMPNLSPEDAVDVWGERIIKAEEERTAKGGVPIYNPTIAKVKVHWNIFHEHYYSQKQLRANKKAALEDVTLLRPQADDLILDIWNQVERFYGNLPQEEKLAKCRQFGVVYYDRTKKAKKKNSLDQQNFIDF